MTPFSFPIHPFRIIIEYSNFAFTSCKAAICAHSSELQVPQWAKCVDAVRLSRDNQRVPFSPTEPVSPPTSDARAALAESSSAPEGKENPESSALQNGAAAFPFAESATSLTEKLRSETPVGSPPHQAAASVAPPIVALGAAALGAAAPEVTEPARETLREQSAVNRNDFVERPKARLANSVDKRAINRRPVFVAASAGGVLLLSGLSFFAWHSSQNSSASLQKGVANTTTVNSSTRTTPTPASTPAPSATNNSLPSILQQLQQTPNFNAKGQKAGKPDGQTLPAAASSAPPSAKTANPNTGNSNAAASPLPGTSALPAASANAQAAARTPLEAAFNRAVDAQKAGRNEEALSAYRSVLALKPDLVPARVNLALLLLQMKRPGEALPELKAARKLDPKNPSLPWQIAQTLVELKRPREAIEPLQTVVALAPKNPQGRAVLAQLLASVGRPAQALEQWKALSALTPKQPDAAFAAGSLAASLKRFDEAETYLRRARKIADKTSPKDPRPTLQLARVLADKGDTREAESLLSGGTKRFPQVVEMGTLLSDVRLARGDKAGAVRALKNVLPQVPASVQKGQPRGRLLVAMGRLLGQSKRWKESAKALASASALLPREPDVHALWGEALLQSGDEKGAAVQLRHALQLDPKRNDLRLPLARTLTASGQLPQATIEYSKLLRVQPNNPGWLAEQAEILERQKKYEASLSNWRRIERALPENPLPMLQSARLLRGLKRDRESLSKFRQTLQLTPNQPDALLGAAQLEEKLGQDARALAHWRDLVQVRPAYLPAYNSLMKNAAKRRQTTATANFLKPILARHPENPVAFDAVLRAFDQEGKPEDGRAYVRTFAQKFPNAVAPRRALTAFDLKNARRKLRDLEQNDKIQNDKAQAAPSSTRPPASTLTPAATPTPKSTPKTTPDTSSDVAPGATPSATTNATPSMTTQPTTLPHSAITQKPAS
jgi:tetratricopeptide (TPR) repeat protein